jgi:hypothetical protein
MSVEGRVSVDVLFHDRDGTNAINTLTIQDVDGYSSGVVAYWHGTCGTTAVTLAFGPTTYRDASGGLATVQPGGSSGLVAFLATGNGGRLTQSSGPITLLSFGHACVSNLDEQESVAIAAENGTTEYTVIVWSA